MTGDGAGQAAQRPPTEPHPLEPPPPPGALHAAPLAPPPPPAPGANEPIEGAGSTLHPLRELLFADLPASQARSVFANAGPAGATILALADAAEGRDVAKARIGIASAPPADTDTRLHLQAWSLAREAGVRATDGATDVLGVVVDMGLDDGLDTLAGFADGSARYLNHSGASIVWEAPDPAVERLVRALLASAAIVVAMGAPLEGRRLRPPAAGNTMISVLTRSGTYVGAGPVDVIATDPRGGPVIGAATQLLETLVKRADEAHTRDD